MTTETKDEIQQNVINPAIEKYLKTGSHIGTRFKSGDMARYIYKQRRDGLKVLDVQVIDERVKVVGSFLSKYAGDKIVVVSRRVYGKTPAEEFAASIGARAITGRFVPGTFTNPEGKEFIQPEVVIVTEPESDLQAIKEATIAKAVVIALSSTNNVLQFVDMIIPVNNKGRKSLALIYWLLAKEVLRGRNELPSDESFGKTVEQFEYPMKEGEEEEGSDRKRRMNRGRRGPYISRYEAAAGIGPTQ